MCGHVYVVCVLFGLVFCFCFGEGGRVYINMSDRNLQRQSLLTYIVVGLFLNHSI